ncbi:MAG TPA: hypothetical protein PKH65_10780 [Bacteroidia bacterium]|nr:hypothetical protein [Bacteroidia bacterium]HNT81154.1 hypothetical protein [Bacteroidia bacterium]
MTKVFYAIGSACEAFFEVLKALGPYTNWLFILLIGVGCLYWTLYEIKVNKGGRNYLGGK